MKTSVRWFPIRVRGPEIGHLIEGFQDQRIGGDLATLKDPLGYVVWFLPMEANIMRTFLFGLLASVLVSMAVAQTLNPRETMTVGVELTLGMLEDAAVKKLTESGYKLRKHEPPDAFKQKGFTSMWFVDDGGDERHTASVGLILFSSGRLTSASKELLPSEDGQVEFARQLYFAMRDLEAEGDSHCAIETETGEVPEYAQKTARLRCGKKSIVIYLQKAQNKNESVQLNLEMASR
jgi:hypothetical protein